MQINVLGTLLICSSQFKKLKLSRTISQLNFIGLDKSIQKEVYLPMKQSKLTYRFHNPNTPEATADYILKLFVEVNTNKVERALQEVADNIEEQKEEYLA